MMTAAIEIRLIYLAGVIYAGIVLANIPLPRKLKTAENLATVPRFLRQVFYVHWFYIVLIVAFFSVLCFGFPKELMGASLLGRFLSAFMAGFWFVRLVLQLFCYDPELRRQLRALDAVYNLVLVALVAIFGFAALYPVR
jgi:hypothetical protein